MSALTAYLTATNDPSLLTTARQLTNAAPAAESSAASGQFAKNGTGWSELFAQGGNATLAATPEPSPSGHGFLWDVITLEAQQIQAGTWTPTIKLSTGGGTFTVTIVVRAFLYNGGVYTQIGTDMTRTGVALSSTATAFAIAGVAQPAMSFTTGDKLYLDVLVNITTGSSSNTAAQRVISLFENGGANDAVVTPGFVASPIQGAAALSATRALSARGALLLRASAAFSVTGALSASGGVLRRGTSTLAAALTLSAAAVELKSAAASLTGALTLTAAGTVVSAGGGAVNGTAALSASCTLSAAGTLASSGNGALASTAALSAAGALILSGAASLTQSRSLTAAGSGVYAGAANLTAALMLSATGPALRIPSITPPTAATINPYRSAVAIRPYRAAASVYAYSSTCALRAYFSTAAVRSYAASPAIVAPTTTGAPVAYTSSARIGPTLG